VPLKELPLPSAYHVFRISSPFLGLGCAGLLALTGAAEALGGLAVAAVLAAAHAHHLGVDGGAHAVVHLSVDLGEHVACVRDEGESEGGWVVRTRS